jgi:hypothetical protein
LTVELDPGCTGGIGVGTGVIGVGPGVPKLGAGQLTTSQGVENGVGVGEWLNSWVLVGAREDNGAGVGEPNCWLVERGVCVNG